MPSVTLESALCILLKRRNAQYAPRTLIRSTINAIRVARSKGL